MCNLRLPLNLCPRAFEDIILPFKNICIIPPTVVLNFLAQIYKENNPTLQKILSPILQLYYNTTLFFLHLQPYKHQLILLHLKLDTHRDAANEGALVSPTLETTHFVLRLTVQCIPQCIRATPIDHLPTPSTRTYSYYQAPPSQQLVRPLHNKESIHSLLSLLLPQTSLRTGFNCLDLFLIYSVMSRQSDYCFNSFFCSINLISPSTV